MSDVSDKSTRVKPVFENADCSIEVSDEGNVTLVRLKQPVNALALIIVIDDGKVTLVRLVQLLKILYSIEVRDVHDKSTCVRLVQP